MNEAKSTNPVYLRLRRIYCAAGAEFCRPDLEAAWKEIKWLEARYEALAAMLRDDELVWDIAEEEGAEAMTIVHQYNVLNEYRARLLAKIDERKDAQ